MGGQSNSGGSNGNWGNSGVGTPVPVNPALFPPAINSPNPNPGGIPGGTSSAFDPTYGLGSPPTLYPIGNGAVGSMNDPASPIGQNLALAGLRMYMNPYRDMSAINEMAGQQYGRTGSLIQSNVGSFGQDAQSQMGLGQQQYGENQDLINQQMAARSQARGQLAGYLNDQATQTLKQSLPGTAETFNTGGLLDSTGYQQEVARQQGNLAANVQNQLGIYGLNDIDMQSQAQTAALGQLQGSQNQALQSQLAGSNYARTSAGGQEEAYQNQQQSGLQRAFSMEDFANQAAASKQTGLAVQPQVGSGKGGGGSSGAMSGLGSGAAAGSAFGPYGAAIGAIGGGIYGAMNKGNGSGGGK